MTPRILIVDDEARMAAAIATALERSGYACETATSGQDALAAFDARGADVVVTDRKMPGMDGIELLRAVHRRKPDVPVVLITAFADVPSAVKAMREGAFDYVAKPFDNHELRSIVGRAVELTKLQRENRYLRQEIAGRYSPDSLVAESPAIKDVLSLIQRVARAKASVLIQGESGTGKELCARLLHYWSDRVGQPFVAINCKALAPGVLESELFGHEKGAYTGAAQARAGCFERADGGTLFLDEIGEVDPDFQAKLLRVLQEGEVLRVGGTTPRNIDVRVVAATNRKLTDEIAAGRFRQDLFFRLNVVPLALPPLRERREDLLPLAERFLTQIGRPLRLGEDARQALLAHSWPGNVRELENVIERASLLATTETIEPEDLLLTQTTAPSTEKPTGTLKAYLDRATVERIRGALDEAEGQRGQAAEILGIDRTTLYRLIRRLNI
ncbi:MAG: sigma-54 dependent transcriptional regulator [Proteobacteria bacterium]|nr:sigma-54 dependent transcriptional regulator [Pseudomonadota bacterium]